MSVCLGLTFQICQRDRVIPTLFHLIIAEKTVVNNPSWCDMQAGKKSRCDKKQNFKNIWNHRNKQVLRCLLLCVLFCNCFVLFCITHKVIMRKRKAIKAEIDEKRQKILLIKIRKILEIYLWTCLLHLRQDKEKEEEKTFLMGRYITILIIAKDYHLAWTKHCV